MLTHLILILSALLSGRCGGIVECRNDSLKHFELRVTCRIAKGDTCFIPTQPPAPGKDLSGVSLWELWRSSITAEVVNRSGDERGFASRGLWSAPTLLYDTKAVEIARHPAHGDVIINCNQWSIKPQASLKFDAPTRLTPRKRKRGYKVRLGIIHGCSLPDDRRGFLAKDEKDEIPSDTLWSRSFIIKVQ